MQKNCILFPGIEDCGVEMNAPDTEQEERQRRPAFFIDPKWGKSNPGAATLDMELVEIKTQTFGAL